MSFAPRQAVLVATPMTQSAVYANLRVVVVIESVFVLLDVDDTLREIGCGAIRATSSPTQALAALGSHDFDAAILGIGERTANGQALVTELERLRIPIILVESETALSRGLVHAAGQLTVTVPFDTAAIADAIDRALARR